MSKNYKHKKLWRIATNLWNGRYELSYDDSWIVEELIVWNSDREEIKENIIISSVNFDEILSRLNKLTRLYESYINTVGKKSYNDRELAIRKRVIDFKQDLFLYLDSIR